MNTFTDYAKAYQNWRLKEKGSSKIPKEELKWLRENYAREQKSNVPNRQKFVEALKDYRQWKSKKGEDSIISYEEYLGLREQIVGKEPRRISNKKSSFDSLLENYRHYLASKTGQGSKLTYRELKELQEAFERNKGRLREAEPGFDPAPAPVAGSDPMAGGDPMMAGGMPPVTPVDPSIAAQIQDVKQSVDALATAAGVQTTDLGADPNAAVPPVDGMAQPPVGGNPNAMPANPMMESKVRIDKSTLQEAVLKYRNYKLKEYGTGSISEDEIKVIREGLIQAAQKPKSKIQMIKDRLAARQAQLQNIKENGAQELARKELSAAGLGTELHSNSEPYAGAETNEELVKIPSEGSIARGVSGGKGTEPGKTWPTKPTNGAHTGGAFQGSGASQHGNKVAPKVKEAQEKDEDEDKEELNESTQSVQSVTESYIKRLYEPKLDFSVLKEALRTGRLG